MPLIVLPDAVPPTIGWLNATTEVTGLVAHRIYVRLPDKEVWPAIRIDPLGGDPILEYRLDQPNLQIHYFAAGQNRERDAMAGAYVVRAAVLSMAGYRVANQFCVGEVTTSTPQLLPDEDRQPPIAHATFSAAVAIRPDP